MVKKIISLVRSQTLKDTIISSIGLFATAAIGFVYTTLLARTLGPSLFGIYSAVTALGAIAYSTGDLGLCSAVINLLPKKVSQAEVIISTAFLSQIILSIGIFLIFSLFSVFNNILIPNSLPEHLILIGILSINYLLLNLAQAIFTAKRQFWAITLSQILDAVIKISIVFVLLKISNLSISTAITANIFSSLLALLISFRKELLGGRMKFSQPILKDLSLFARWIAISRFFSVLISKIDVVLLNLLASSYYAGIYASASRVTIFFALVVSSLNTVVNSRYASFTTHSQVISYSKKLFLLVLAIIAGMVLCVFLAPQIITIAFGEKYLPSIPVFQWLVISMIPFMFFLITTPTILYYFNDPKFFARLSAIQVVLMIIMELALIPTMNVYAPILASGVSNLLALCLSVYEINKLLNNSKNHAHRIA